MPVTDPVDARLLTALAEVGKIAVHELAIKVGMDPREVAYRLVALSGSGLPLLVGVESDPQGLRIALMRSTPPPPQTPQTYLSTPPPPVPVAPGYANPAPLNPTSMSASPAMSTWGPPQTAAWARKDAPSKPEPAPITGPHTGRIGDSLRTHGLEGGAVTLQLLEVQDPADFLFSAAGYRLDAGERAIVVHTEITNHQDTPFGSLPDDYLELLTAEGRVIRKAPISLTSRPPHRIGVRPGQTVGGHTVYVLADTIRITSVRWSPRPEPDERSIQWMLT